MSDQECSKRQLDCKDDTCLILFDWDDTLLSSSFLAALGVGGVGNSRAHHATVPADCENQLRLLETAVINLLKVAMRYGRVCIITNAETGWVQLSASKFMPGVVPLLSEIKVFSARSAYESLFPDSPKHWKMHAFRYEVSLMVSENHEIRCRNIMSFGDSHVEREAVHAVKCELQRYNPDVRMKSVKFVERPTMEQLRRQLELVTQFFSYIAEHTTDLDLMLSLSMFNKNAAHAQADQSAQHGAATGQDVSAAAQKEGVSPLPTAGTVCA